jgi:non-specific serine/threonine protein kinase
VVAGEYDNLRAALVRAFEHADMGAAIRVANVLCRFWNRRGIVGEAYRWLESIVERSHDVPASMRASVLGSAATTARRYGDWARSAAHAQESLDLARRAGHPRAIALALLEVGHALDPLRRPGDAMQRYLEALDVASRANDQGRIAAGLQGVALASCGQGELAKAARLLGAAEVLFEATGIEYAPTSVAEQTVMGRTIVTLLTGLGREAFGQAWAEGRRMPRSQAVDYALGRTALPDMPVAPVPTAGQPQDQNPLTPREREVAALIAQGFSNREIAAKLVVSERTVDAHLQHILNKLGFHSRAQVAAWVAVAR